MFCGASETIDLASLQQVRFKNCLVCGDKALSCNFGAITCESCKAFFRRNAHKEVWSRCNGSCPMTTQTRSYCKKCRLEKCFSVGMRKESILSEKQKEIRRQKILENRSKRKQSACMWEQSNILPVVKQVTESISPDNSINSDDNCRSSLVSEFTPRVSCMDNHDQLREESSSNVSDTCMSVSNWFELDNNVLEDSSVPVNIIAVPLTRDTKEVSCNDSFLEPKLQPKVEVIDQVDSCIAQMRYYKADKEKEMILKTTRVSHGFTTEISGDTISGLDPHNRAVIEEVIASFRVSFDCPLKQPLGVSGLELAAFLNLADETIRRLVKMAKHLLPFKQLNQDTQIRILKGCVMEVLIFRSIKAFDHRGQLWLSKGSIGKDNEYISTTALVNEGRSYFKLYSDFAVFVREYARDDSLIIMFLMVLCLFKPERMEEPTRSSLAEAQAHYAGAFQAYLQNNYENSTSIFTNVKGSLDRIEHISKTQTELLAKAKVEDLEPLLLEIFDMSK